MPGAFLIMREMTTAFIKYTASTFYVEGLESRDTIPIKFREYNK